MLGAAREAADALAADGIEATVWDVRVVPLDPEMLADAAEHPVVLTAEDGVRDGGVGSMIADALPGKVRVLGTPVEFIQHGKPDQILADLGLDANGPRARGPHELVAALRA